MINYFVTNYNYIIASAAASWFLAQLIKTILHWVIKRNFKPERLIGSGGMPSSHSAFVSAATIATGRMCGINSPIFAVIFVIACVVIYDAMGVRRAAGKHAKELNRIREVFRKSGLDDTGSEPFQEFLGHNSAEVCAGVALGIIVAVLMPTRI